MLHVLADKNGQFFLISVILAEEKQGVYRYFLTITFIDIGAMMQSNSQINGKQLKSKEEIQDWLVNQVAGLLFVNPKSIDITAPFSSFGLSSRDAVMLSGDLEEWLDRRFSPTLVYEYPTITALVDFLSSDQDLTPEQQPEIANQATFEKRQSSEDILTELEQLSDDEAEALLLQKLTGLSRYQ